MLKKTVIALYIVVVVILAAATIVERLQGTPYVAEHVYGTWWFAGLWALLAAMAVFYFVRRRVRRPSVVVLHLSFVVILAGALLTHLTAWQGIIHLREGDTESRYMTEDGRLHPLPFRVSLREFRIVCHEGTQAPADYISELTVDGRAATVSMNQIATIRGVRLYQSSYDADQRGTVLTVNSDPWGIPVTYLGYALLFVGLLWMLVDPRGAYRGLLRRAAAAASLCIVCCPVMAAPRSLPAETADRFARLFVVYNDRVCPMETYALDFTKKLCGRSHYGRYSASQVLTGFIFFYDDWSREPIIKVKGSGLRERLHLPAQASLADLFTDEGYILGPYLQDKDARKIDERVELIMELHQGTPLKIFPYTGRDPASSTRWYAPTDPLPDNIDGEHEKYIREVFTLLNGELQAGHYERANQYLDKMMEYQRTFGRSSLPSSLREQAEHIYNNVPFATILFMACLTIGMLLFVCLMVKPEWLKGMGKRVAVGLLMLCFLALTCCLVLRWMITGHVPIANGYETMLFLAWTVMLLSLLASRRFPVMLSFGFLLVGFFLLASHISQMDPKITPLMPVLSSPLLALHVSIVMMAYALLSLTFACALVALCCRRMAGQLQLLSLLMLFPALTCLGFGIFIGAVWANVSWGTYWSWDPKETWALITLMVYAAPAHRSMRSSVRAYHVYMALAFLTILMTYFGVNYFLGGMHSYA